MTEKKTEFENAEYLDKEVNETHRGLADYIRKTTGKKVSPAMAALVLRLYSVYLKSPEVVEAREAEKARKEEERKAREAEKFQAKRRKLAKIEAERARLLADLDLPEDGGPDADAEGKVLDASERFVGTPDEVETSEPEETPPWDEEEAEEGIVVDESEDEFQIPDEDENSDDDSDEDDSDDDWETEDDDEEEDF